MIVFSGFLFNFEALAAAVPATHLSLRGDYATVELAGLMASFFFGEMLLPFYCVRALAAQDPKQAGEGFMAAGLFGFPWMLVVVTIGVIGGGTVTGVATDQIFLKTMEAYLPVGVLGLVLAGIFGIIMSSQDSCLHSGSVAFSIDIFQHFRPNTPPATLLRYSQWIVGVIGVVAILFALRVPNLIDALLYVYTLWAPTVVPPLIIGLLWKRVPRACGLAGIIGGGIGAAVWEWGLSNPYGVPVAGGWHAGQPAGVFRSSCNTAPEGGRAIMNILIAASCGICIIAGVYVVFVIVREFPSLRNRDESDPPA